MPYIGLYINRFIKRGMMEFNGNSIFFNLNTFVPKLSAALQVCIKIMGEKCSRDKKCWLYMIPDELLIVIFFS